MESEPTPTPTTAGRRPAGSSARRGSASAASRARSGAPRVDPPRPSAVLVADEVAEPVDVSAEEAVASSSAPGAATEAPEAPVEEVPAPEPDADDAAAEGDDADAEVESDAGELGPVAAALRGTKRRPVRATAPESPATAPVDIEVALSVQGLTKYFDASVAVDGIDLEVAPGSFFGIVGPNGAGKTTTLSMVTGLLRPDGGVVRVYGLDVWQNAKLAKRKIGVLPDRLRLFDRLTGAEFLYHAGALRGLDRATIAKRSADLSAAFGLEHSLHRLVSDYSAGMTKKIAIAAAMIHAPRLLVLDEPFESVDPVSASVVIDVLKRFVASGGTVVLSSHSMELTERVCDSIAIIADGRVLAAGSIESVLDGRSLEERFVELAGGESAVEGMEWLQNFSD